MNVVGGTLLLLAWTARRLSCGDSTPPPPPRIVCDGAVFNDVYYDKVLLLRYMGRPTNLLMHKFSGNLFFSQTVDRDDRIDFEIKACHLQRKRCESVRGVPGGYAIGYDAGNDDLYLGGHDGIYKYNFVTRVAEFFSEDGKSVWGIFIRRNFYYIRYPSLKLYVYSSFSFEEVAEAAGVQVEHFFVSRAGDIYFSNASAVFKIEKPLGGETLVLDDEVTVRQIAEDGYGDVYFCAATGVYIDEKPFNRLKRVLAAPDLYGLTFDEDDNPILSDENSVYKLVSSRFAKHCYKYVRDKHKPTIFALV